MDVQGGSRNQIIGNTITNNTNIGINQESNPYGTTIEGNFISNNGLGIQIYGLNGLPSIIKNNSIIKNTGYGIFINVRYVTINFTYNLLQENGDYGIYLDLSSSSGNYIAYNDFILNGNTNDKQVYSDRNSNMFIYNYYSSQSFNDTNTDGYADTSYQIDGPGNSIDSFPVVEPYTVQHTITDSNILSPLTGDNVSEMVLISWTKSTDSLNHTIYYSLYYSDNNGSTWNLIISDLTNTSILWNTRTVNNSNSYLLKVLVRDTQLQVKETIMNNIFIIDNIPHTLSSPVVLTPTLDEIINGTVMISWQLSNDSLNHTVSYTILYSSDDGHTWKQLVKDLTNTSYMWDTTLMEDGAIYKIKIISSDNLSLSNESISETFSIRNTEHVLTSVTLSNPTGGEILQDLVTITWTASVDSWDHNVTYIVYYWSNDGQNWIELVNDLTNASFIWNTTLVPDGTAYRIKILASDKLGLSIETVSEIFSIRNIEHTLTHVSFLFPVGGETVQDKITISWTSSTDSWSHNVTYNVYYSSDNGETWIELVNDYAGTSYTWDISSVFAGDRYLIKIIASDTILSEETIMDGTITILNNPITSTSTTSTTTSTSTTSTTPTTSQTTSTSSPTTTSTGTTSETTSQLNSKKNTTQNPTTSPVNIFFISIAFLIMPIVLLRKRKQD